MRRHQKTLVGGVKQRAALPESAKDEETAANTGRRSEQRETLSECARDEETAANTGRRRAANTGTRSEQRATLPGSARNEERASNTNNHHEIIYCKYVSSNIKL